MDQVLLDKVMERVASEIKVPGGRCKISDIGVSEFVGTTMGNTIGLVIASADPALTDVMHLGRFRSIGILGGRTGFAPQAMAMDDAVKATNTEVISMEAAKDDMGQGQGSLILIGADDVSDVRRAIEIALANVEKYFGDIYENSSGHLEYQYTARASYCLEKGFGTPVGKAFGLVCGAPAAIGTVLSDTALKAANVEVVSYTSPAGGEGYAFQNEVTMTITGDSGAVRQAVRASIEIGKKLLGAFGEEPKSCSTPYI